MAEAQMAPRRTAKEQFDRQATQYNSQWNSWSEETLSWLLDASAAATEDAVLDVATGTGFTALAFAPRVRRVVGVDVSPGMLAEAQRRAQEQGISNVEFREAAADALPFDDGTFDIVTCRIAAHHFPDVPKFLVETARVLKPGGRFLLVDTTVPDDDPEAADWQNAVEAVRDTSHARNWTPNQWRGMVEAAGLRVEQVTDAGSGITIPLEDWMVKAGCTPEQAADVRARFEAAPEGARRAFAIQSEDDQVTHFTWRRVLLRAVKN